MRASVRRAATFAGVERVPGDKSISHRAVLFAALAQGTTRLRGLGPGADVRTSLACVERLGCVVRRVGDTVEIDSPGRDGWTRDVGTLDAGNSGTSARFLLGLLAGVPGLTATLVGDASLSQRPMKRVAEPLARMGARVALTNGSLPAQVVGTALHGVAHDLPIASAQVKSALLLAGLSASGETWVREPSPSRDHTERMLPAFGVDVRRGDAGVGVIATVLRSPEGVVDVPGDASSAAFLGVAAAVCGGSIRIEHVSLNGSRIAAFEVLRRMGADVTVTGSADVNGEPVGVLEVRSGAMRGTTIAGDELPLLLDEVPILAIAAACASGETVIRDAAELRVKESDRLAAMAAGLVAMGADVDERPDGLVIRGGRPLHGAVVDARQDHRIAMAFTVAGLVADGETIVEGAEWADVSWPGFFDVVARLSGGAVRTWE